MSDTSLNTIIQYGLEADRLLFTPDPAVGSKVLYFWYETDNPPNLYAWDGAGWVLINVTSAATGDVVGPALAVDDRIAVYDGTDGKLIKDGGATIAEIIALIPLDTDTGITELTGHVIAGPGDGSQVAVVDEAIRTHQIGITIDGAGVVLTTGLKGYKSFPVAGTIVGVRLLADQAGAIVIDIWKDTYANYPPVNADSITAAAPPTIAASGVKSEDVTLAGWNVDVAAGDVFGFNIDSVTAITRITLELTIVVS